MFVWFQLDLSPLPWLLPFVRSQNHPIVLAPVKFCLCAKILHTRTSPSCSMILNVVVNINMYFINFVVVFQGISSYFKVFQGISRYFKGVSRCFKVFQCMKARAVPGRQASLDKDLIWKLSVFVRLCSTSFQFFSSFSFLCIHKRRLSGEVGLAYFLFSQEWQFTFEDYSCRLSLVRPNLIATDFPSRPRQHWLGS